MIRSNQSIWPTRQARPKIDGIGKHLARASLLLGPAVFFLPGLGLVAMAGPVVAALVSALEGAVVVGSLSALGAALTQIGVPKDQVIKYETALKVDKYILMVHGSEGDAGKVRVVLASSKLLAAV